MAVPSTTDTAHPSTFKTVQRVEPMTSRSPGDHKIIDVNNYSP